MNGNRNDGSRSSIRLGGAQPQRSGNIVSRHWRGDYSTGKAALIAFIAVLVLAPAVLIGIRSIGGSMFDAYVPSAVIGLWGGVGMLRSGLKLARDHSKTTAQRTQSFVPIMFGAIFIIGEIFGFAVVFFPDPPPPAQHQTARHR